MKKITLLGCLVLAAVAQAQISQPGDIAFVGWNADGDDDIAFVTFKDIAPNTKIYFCDSEWNGTAFPAGDEGDFTWNSGAQIVPAGTVISINNVSAAITPSVGTIENNNAGGLSASSEAMFAFLGAPRTPSVHLAAIANAASGFGSLANTGLSIGTTAVLLPEGTDIGIYNGPRNGLDINGFHAQLHAASNWQLEDSSADDHINGTTPDLPFNAGVFTVSDSDATAPSVASIAATQATVSVVFSESVAIADAQNLENYSFSPALAISSAAYDATLNKVTLTHAGFATGIAYTLSISGINDVSDNEMSNYTSEPIFFNALASGLLITEIMYNAPSDNSNELEFLEIYNNSDNAIALGGICIKDEANFVFRFPEMNLASHRTVLLATDKASADAFYGAEFLDMPQGIVNALGNGGELLQVLNTQDGVISQVAYDDSGAWPTAADGNGPSIELKDLNGNLNSGDNWQAATNLVGQSLGSNVYASPGIYEQNASFTASFDDPYKIVDKTSGSVSIDITVTNIFTEAATIQLSVMPNVGTAISGTDFTLSAQTLNFAPNATTTQTVNVPVLNAADGKGKFFVLRLTDTDNTPIEGTSTMTVYLKDANFNAPAASVALDLQYLDSYLVDANGSAEIVAHDPATQRLFVVNSTATKLAILDFSNPEQIAEIAMIDMTQYGIGATSVAFKNGMVVATVEGADFGNGKVVFMDANGQNISSVEAGVLPDMVTFTHDGLKVLTANEGQPNSDYGIDPEGTISVIDVSGGLGNITQADVTNINFNAFDSQKDALKASGVRIFGPNASVSQDLEPEYITVSADNQTAWVTLQENNAVARISLANNVVTDILPLGTKDHNLPANTLDTSDQLGEIFLANWPVKGLYMPDAMANFTVGGTTYLVTANEGDAREYDNMEEEMKIGDADYVLDATVFPNAAELKRNTSLGRLAVTSASGDTDGDGDYDEIHAFGTRSFSIWNGTTGALVYDSGDDFERITAADPVYGAWFNASNDNANFKNRSDNKGPEPEGVTVAEINGAFYAFITLERIGGVMVYDVTNPQSPTFVTYKNSRNGNGGDLGPEGIIYIKPADSPVDTGLVVVANEVSATLSIYRIANDLLGIGDVEPTESFAAYPNPVRNGQLFFNRPVSVEMFDLSGRSAAHKKDASSLEIANLSSGIYILKTTDGASQKIVVE
ncbi:choice-of-anchor I family protein [Flavobacterium selenitireducens]|uniref:choice-of-anchor I family protein n=1 Tax=Flavobacterium selenitireducens TaxID=2722704 RepID=UPI00168B56B9|nr:choice-of-anchor I family protein [Flavobacterium selenitireducens]MBD3582634.1 T9SS type A sorting domain-containing protein [Flavobacterium selenitireducens]